MKKLLCICLVLLLALGGAALSEAVIGGADGPTSILVGSQPLAPGERYVLIAREEENGAYSYALVGAGDGAEAMTLLGGATGTNAQRIAAFERVAAALQPAVTLAAGDDPPAISATQRAASGFSVGLQTLVELRAMRPSPSSPAALPKTRPASPTAAMCTSGTGAARTPMERAAPWERPSASVPTAAGRTTAPPGTAGSSATTARRGIPSAWAIRNTTATRRTAAAASIMPAHIPTATPAVSSAASSGAIRSTATTRSRPAGTAAARSTARKRSTPSARPARAISATARITALESGGIKHHAADDGRPQRRSLRRGRPLQLRWQRPQRRALRHWATSTGAMAATRRSTPAAHWGGCNCDGQDHLHAEPEATQLRRQGSQPPRPGRHYGLRGMLQSKRQGEPWECGGYLCDGKRHQHAATEGLRRLFYDISKDKIILNHVDKRRTVSYNERKRNEMGMGM